MFMRLSVAEGWGLVSLPHFIKLTSIYIVYKKQKRMVAERQKMIVTREMGTKLPDTTMSRPVYFDARKEPISLHGFCEPYRRLPEDVAKATSEGVAHLSLVSTGGRIRFRTDSDFIVVHAELNFSELTPNSSPAAC